MYIFLLHLRNKRMCSGHELIPFGVNASAVEKRIAVAMVCYGKKSLVAYMWPWVPRHRWLKEEFARVG